MDRITRLFGVQPNAKARRSRWGVPAVLVILLGMALFTASCESTLLEEPQVTTETNAQELMAKGQQNFVHREPGEAKLAKAKKHFQQALENGDISEEQYQGHLILLEKAHANWQQDKKGLVEFMDGDAFFLSDEVAAHFNATDMTKAQLKQMLHDHHGELSEMDAETIKALHEKLRKINVEGGELSGDSVWINAEGTKSLKEIRELHPDAKRMFLPEEDLHTETESESLK